MSEQLVSVSKAERARKPKLKAASALLWNPGSFPESRLRANARQKSSNSGGPSSSPAWTSKKNAGKGVLDNSKMVPSGGTEPELDGGAWLAEGADASSRSICSESYRCKSPTFQQIGSGQRLPDHSCKYPLKRFPRGLALGGA